MLVLTVSSCTQRLHHGIPAVFLPTADIASPVVAMPLHNPHQMLEAYCINEWSKPDAGMHHDCISNSNKQRHVHCSQKACSSNQSQRLALLGVGGRPELCVCWANAFVPERVLWRGDASACPAGPL